MSNRRFKLIAAVYLLLVQDHKVLLLRRYNTGYEDGKYSLIAGHLDGGEPLRKAMAREAAEEAGIAITPHELRLVHVLHRFTPAVSGRADERVEFFFTTNRWQGTPQIMEPDRCDEMAWFDVDALPDLTLGYIHHVIDSVRHGVTCSELGWPSE